MVADCADFTGNYAEIFFLDSVQKVGTKVADWNIEGTPEEFEKFDFGCTDFFIAIGNNHIRAKLLKEVLAKGANVATLIHPNASIGRQVTIGKGTVVLSGAVINILSSVGQGCIVNTGATVDHDCTLEDFVHIGPGVNLAGTVELGEYVFVGAGGTVIPGISVGPNTTVGAGATVVADIPKNVTAVGTPAKVIKQHH